MPADNEDELARAVEEERRLYDEIASFRVQTSIDGVMQVSPENAKRLAELHSRQDAIQKRIRSLLGK